MDPTTIAEWDAQDLEREVAGEGGSRSANPLGSEASGGQMSTTGTSRSKQRQGRRNRKSGGGEPQEGGAAAGAPVGELQKGDDGSRGALARFV